MFCSICSCELPPAAKFCAGCGLPIESESRLAVGSFCVNCGKQYNSSYKYCNFCGHPVPVSTLPIETKTTDHDRINGAADLCG
jgi:hypothetical protein